MIAMAGGGAFYVFEIAEMRPVLKADLPEPDTQAAAYWSPDGRYIAHASFRNRHSGIWLVDTKQHRQRLLAEISAVLPRWSPDGRFIAVDERTRDEIVILDVSSLDLSQGLGDNAAPTASGPNEGGPPNP
jgi:Tol biopolymer transport system component